MIAFFGVPPDDRTKLTRRRKGLLGARHGDVEAARQLLQSGVDMNARDRHGQTALMLAAHHGHRPLVELLVGQGADLKLTATFVARAATRRSEHP